MPAALFARRPRSASEAGKPDPVKLAAGDRRPADSLYCFSIEECILCASEGRQPQCPEHGATDLAMTAPDTVRPNQ